MEIRFLKVMLELPIIKVKNMAETVRNKMVTSPVAMSISISEKPFFTRLEAAEIRLLKRCDAAAEWWLGLHLIISLLPDYIGLQNGRRSIFKEIRPVDKDFRWAGIVESPS